MIFFTRTDPTRNVNRFYIVERIKTKRSVAQMTRSMAYHPGVQQAIADIAARIPF